MKKIIIKFLNRYSIVYVPIGLILFSFLLDQLIYLPINIYLLSSSWILIFYGLKIYTSKRYYQSNQDENFDYSIIEFYSDY